MFKFIGRLILSASVFASSLPAQAAIDGSGGQFFYRYKTPISERSVPDDTQNKDISAFFVGGVEQPFSEFLPVKPEWEKDSWRIINGTLPSGLHFDPMTLTISGTPEVEGLATLVVFEGIDANGNAVGKATASFDIHVIQGVPVKVDAYAHKNRYRLVELAIPAGVAVDNWSRSSAPKGIAASGPFFEGTPTEVGTTPIYLEGRDFSGNVLVTFYGTYVVEDAPLFGNFPDDVRNLGQSPSITQWFSKSPPAVKRSLEGNSKVNYYAELEPGGRYPGKITSNGNMKGLIVGGSVSQPYEQARLRRKAVDVDGLPGYSNWWLIGTADPSPECARGSAAGSVSFKTGINYDTKLWGLAGARGTLSYTLLSGDIPSGMVFDPATGRISGYPTRTAAPRLVSVRIDLTNGTNVVSETCDYTISVKEGSLTLADTTEQQSRYVRVGAVFDGTLSVSGGLPPFAVKYDDPASFPTFSFPSGASDISSVAVRGFVQERDVSQIPVTVTNGDGNTDTTFVAVYGRGPIAVDHVDDFSVKRLAQSQLWKSVTFDPLNVIPDVSTYSTQPTFTLNQLDPRQPLPDGLSFNAANGEFTGAPKAAAGVYGPFSVTIRDYSGEAADSNQFSITVDPRDDLKIDIVAAADFKIERSALQSTKVSTTTQPSGAQTNKLSYSLNGNPPVWLSIDPDTGELEAGTIPFESIGTFGPFTITVTDGESTASSTQFSVTASDISEPAAKDVAPVHASVSGDTSKGETATFVGIVDLKQYVDTDTIIGGLDGVTLTSIDPPSPAGLTFNATGMGSLSGVPVSEFAGDVIVGFADAKGRTGTITIPLEVRPYPTVSMTTSSFDLPRLSDAVAASISGQQGSGFWSSPKWSLDGSPPSGLGVDPTLGVVNGRTSDPVGTLSSGLRLKAVSIGGDGVTQLVSFTGSFTVRITAADEIGLTYDPVVHVINMTGQPGSLTYVNSAPMAVPKPTGSYVAPLVYSLDDSDARQNGMTGSIGINPATGFITGSSDTLGEWTVHVGLSDNEGRSLGSPVALVIRSTLSGEIALAGGGGGGSGGGGTYRLRQSEPFETDPLILSNAVGGAVFSTTPAVLDSGMDFSPVTGSFSDDSVIDTVRSNYAVAVQATDEHGRKLKTPIGFNFTTVAPLKLSVSSRTISTKQYSAASGDVVNADFDPVLTNRIGNVSYALTGAVPGTLVYKLYSSGMTVLSGYSWRASQGDSHDLTVDGMGNVTAHRINGSNVALLQVQQTMPDGSTVWIDDAVASDYFPADAMVFDTKMATLKGIPSETGVFVLNVVATDDHKNAYIKNVSTRDSYNEAKSEDITLSVAAAPDLTVSNNVSGVSGSSETVYRYTSTPTVRTTIANAAYGKGIASYERISGALPAGVTTAISGSSLVYGSYPNEQGTFSTVFKLYDAAGRSITADAVTLDVQPRLALQVVTASNPAGLIVNAPGTVTVSAKNTAYGLPITAADWTVSGVANVPTGMTYKIESGKVTFSGTPTVIKDYTGIVITAKDAIGTSASLTLTIKVISPTNAIVLNVANIAAKVGYPFLLTPTASNTYGTLRYYFQSLDPIYADILSITGDTGKVSGQLPDPITTTFNVTVTDDTNRITTKPVTLTVSPNIRLTVPTTVAATQGSALNRTVDTIYRLGSATYAKGSGNWPTGVAVNVSTGEIVAQTADPTTGVVSNVVSTAVGTYPGLTVKVTDKFVVNGVTYNDVQESNLFSLVVAPINASPVITDPGKTILGTQGYAIVAFRPTVVDSVQKKAWTYSGTTYSLSTDLTQYGLSFDPATGIISGTPTQPFIIRDMVITVRSAAGVSDQTIPFWIGVAPRAALSIAAGQKTAYLERLYDDFRSDDLAVQNYIGNLTVVSRTDTRYETDPVTGAYWLAGSAQDTTYISTKDYTVRVTDEFNRTVDFTINITRKAALVLTTANSTVAIGTQFTLAAPKIAGKVSTLTYSVVGLPATMSVVASTGVISGKVAAADLTNGKLQLVMSVKDSWDGKSVSAPMVITGQ
jgi:hypothetical protein